MAYASWSLAFGDQPTTAKWNILGTNDALFYSHLGANLAWQSWTPTLANITIGNGVTTAKYIQVGKMVIARFSVLFGTTTTIGAATTTFTLPVTASTTLQAANMIIGPTYLKSAGTAYTGSAIMTSSTVCQITVDKTTGDIDSYCVSIATAVPNTWTTNDIIGTTIVYEAA